MSSEESAKSKNEVEELKARIDSLEKAVAEIIAVVKAQTAAQVAQAQGMAPGPTPQPQSQPQIDMTMLMPLFAELLKPKSSKLEEVIVSKAIEGLLSTVDLNRQFMEGLLSKLAEALGKKTGEKMANILVVEE